MTNDVVTLAFGGLRLAFSGWLPPMEGTLAARFVTQAAAADISMRIYQDERLDIPHDAELVCSNGIYRIRQRQSRLWLECCSLGGAALWTYAVTHIDLDKPDKLTYQVLQPDCRFDLDNVLSNMMLESLLLAKNRAIFHASAIEWNGKAILFTAPSGTGKSTQAELWHRYRKAKILNGDKVILHENRAYGLPFAGTSAFCERFSLPIGAIVVLRQGRENRLLPVQPMWAAKELLRQICMESWRSEDISNALNLVQGLLQNVPIYAFECLPDASAVDTLEKMLK